MDTRDIRYFLKMAELSHLGRAAAELAVSQPALSKCIGRMEESFGVQLFERLGRGVVLTESGRLLRDRLQVVNQDLEDIRREVTSYGSGVAGLVRVGCAASIASFFLPRVCRAILAKAPDLRLHVRVGMDDILRNELRAGIVDVTISPRYTGEPDDEILSRGLLDDTVVVVARHGHPLAGGASLEAMADFGWVLPSAAVSTRRWLDGVFRSHGLAAPAPAVTATPLVAAPAIMLETNLLSFMSRRNVKDRSIVEIANPATTLQRSFDISHRTHSYISPAVHYFISQSQASLKRNG